MSEERMVAALKPFGWICGPDFWQRYYRDPWVFNLANIVEYLSERPVVTDEIQAVLDAIEDPLCEYTPNDPVGHGLATAIAAYLASRDRP